MKKAIFTILGMLLLTGLQAQNLIVHFYWFHVQLEASAGGYIYATGDWRLPLSEDDFGTSVTTKWVIAGTNNLSSCYAWAIPEEGYEFVGWYAGNGTQLISTDTVEARIWATTNVIQNEDGIVSGNNLYSLTPSDTIRAVFQQINGPATSLSDTKNTTQSEQMYDVSGRLIRTSQHGQIFIRGGKKYLR